MSTCSYTSILLQLKYLSFSAGVCFPAIPIETIIPSPRASIHTVHGSAEQIHHPLRCNLTTAVQPCSHSSKPASPTKAPHVLMWSSFFSDWSSLGLCWPGHLCLQSQVGVDMPLQLVSKANTGTYSALWVEVRHFLNIYPKTLLSWGKQWGTWDTTGTQRSFFREQWDLIAALACVARGSLA